MSYLSAHGIYSEEASGVRRILLSQEVFWCVAGGIRKHRIQLSEKKQEIKPAACPCCCLLLWKKLTVLKTW